MSAQKEKRDVNQLEAYLRSLILEELRTREIELKESDANLIVKRLVHEVDDLTAKRVKQHFIEIADFIKKKFGEGDA